MEVNIYDILKCLSTHLSNYKGEFEVHIKKDVVYITPELKVFPNIHNKKSSDKEDVMYHVVYHHFPECFLRNDEGIIQYCNIKNIYFDDRINIWRTKFSGSEVVYLFKYSVNQKCRKWIRII